MSNNTKLSVNELFRLDLLAYKKLDKEGVILVLDNIRSAINVGSIFRTADAFKIEKIFLCGITAIPPNKELLKSALGATDSVDWEYRSNTVELVKELKEQSNVQLYCVEQVRNSISLNDFIPENSKKNVFVFGNEIDGVDQDVINFSDGCIEIPQFGTKHSLNVAVSVGITVWDVFSKIQSQKN